MGRKRGETALQRQRRLNKAKEKRQRKVEQESPTTRALRLTKRRQNDNERLRNLRNESPSSVKRSTKVDAMNRRFRRH